MGDLTEPLLQTCATCGALIDVGEEEPFALMHCPTCGSGMRVRMQFDHFELQEVLGSGGMGTVYRALDTNLNRMVALKLLRKEISRDAEFVRQFQTEAAITASINHPHVVKVYSSGEDHGLLYIAMELVDKGSLDDLMNLQGRVAELQVLQVGIQIARGLEAALQRGLIHRDIKPGNILFADAHTAKIVDFGLAVLMEDASNAVGDVWGTPYYVAPEKLDNQPEDFRSDIYSLGATLFHAVAGRPPFEAETASMVALKHLKSQAVSLQAFAPDVSSATAFVINKTLNKERDQRYQSYGELAEHLEYAHGELKQKAGAARDRTRVVVGGAPQQRVMSWFTFVIIAAILLTGTVLYIFRDRFTEPAPKIDPAVQEARRVSAALEPQFQEARGLIADGKYDEAADTFRKLEETPNVPQPLYNWLTLHVGLAELLAERKKEADTAFTRMEARGSFGNDPTEKEIGDFFVSIAKQMTTPAAAPASVAKNFEKSNYEAIGLLLLALKNWNLGDFDGAAALLRQFQSSPLMREPDAGAPVSPYAWIREYKDIASGYLADLSEYRPVADLLKQSADVKARKAALEQMKTVRGRLQLKSRLSATLDQTIAELEKKVSEEEQEHSRKSVEQENADAAAMAEMKPKAAALAAQFKFKEARAAAAAPKLEGEKSKRERDMIVRNMEWLANFKALLATDLTTVGYPKPIARRNGQPLPGGVSGANDQQIIVKIPYGVAPIAWTDVSFDSIFAMAHSFIRPGLAPEAAADRKWHLGVFAFFANKKNEGRTLLSEAAQAKPEYAPALPIFLGSSAEP